MSAGVGAPAMIDSERNDDGTWFWLNIPLAAPNFSPSAGFHCGLCSGVRTLGPIVSVEQPPSDQDSGPRLVKPPVVFTHALTRQGFCKMGRPLATRSYVG